MNENTYLNIGCDFIDSDGVRATTIQLVNKDINKSIATASFSNGKVTSCACIDSVNKPQFLDDAEKLIGNSIPVTFSETKLP